MGRWGKEGGTRLTPEEGTRLTTDKRSWSLKPSDSFSVKSLVNHLSLASFIDNSLQISLWKSKSPRRVNISTWIMLFGSLNLHQSCKESFPLTIFHFIYLLFFLEARRISITYYSNVFMQLIVGAGSSIPLISVGFSIMTKNNVLQILVGPAP